MFYFLDFLDFLDLLDFLVKLFQNEKFLGNNCTEL